MLKKLEHIQWCDNNGLISLAHGVAARYDHDRCKQTDHHNIYIEHDECGAWSGWNEEDLFSGDEIDPEIDPEGDNSEIECQLIEDHDEEKHFWAHPRNGVEIKWKDR